MEEVLISLKNVSKVYNIKKNSFKALDDINLSFDCTGLVLLEGKSGAGKSTLLNILAKNDEPTSGLVNVYDNENSYASVVLQDVILFNDLTIKENMDLVYGFYPLLENKTEYYLNEFKITHIKDNYPNQISGGEKQRVSIIISLIQEKPVLIYDEPTSNLDYENCKLIVEILKKISLNKLVIVSSHNVDMFNGFYTRRIKLEKGKVVLDEIVEKGNALPKEYVKTTFNFKIAKYLVLKNIRKNFVKFINNILIFTLLFVLFFFSLNILFLNVSTMRTNVYLENDLHYIDFNGSEFVEDSKEIKNVKYDQTVLAEQAYPSSISYFSGSYQIDDRSIHRTYFSNMCNEKLHCGKREIGNDEIAVTDTWIKLRYNESNNLYEQYLGNKVRSTIGKELVIVAIIDTDDAPISLQSKSFMAYVCFETFLEMFLVDSFELNLSISNSEVYEVKKITKCDDIEEGHFLVGKNFAEKMQLIVGEKYKITFSRRNHYKIINYDEIDNSLELIFDGYSEENSSSQYLFSEKDYKCAYLNNGDWIFNYGYLGVSIRGVSINDLDSVRKLKLYDDTYLEKFLEEDFRTLNMISKILILFSVPLLIISLFLLVNYSNVIFDKMKSSLKLLKIIGIDRKDIVRVLFYNILLVIIISFILSILLNIIIIPFVSMYTKYVMLNFDLIYFSYIVALILFFVFCLYSLLVWAILNLKISKKIEL